MAYPVRMDAPRQDPIEPDPSSDRRRDAEPGPWRVAALLLVLVPGLLQRWAGAAGAHDADWMTMDGAPTLVDGALLAVGFAIFGLPHGAVDHRVIERLLARRTAHRVGMAQIIAGYVALSLAFLAVWWLFPALAIATFLLMTVWHFGEGDLGHLLPAPSAPAMQRGLALAAILSRGSMVLITPTFAGPAVATPVLAAMLRVDAAQIGSWLTAGAPLVGAAAGLHVALMAAHATLAGPDAGDRSARRRRVGHAALLAVLLLVARPTVAFFAYFTFWHSAGHILRLLARMPPGRAERATASPSAQLRARLVALYRDALPLASAAALGLVALAALAATLPPVAALLTAQAPGALLGLGLVGIAGLTFPHALVVEAMRRLERPRSRAPGAAQRRG